MITKINETIFEFSTPQEPRVERYTLTQMEQFIQICNNDIAIQEAEKAKWETMLAEAEALNA